MRELTIPGSNARDDVLLPVHRAIGWLIVRGAGSFAVGIGTIIPAAVESRGPIRAPQLGEATLRFPGEHVKAPRFGEAMIRRANRRVEELLHHLPLHRIRTEGLHRGPGMNRFENVHASLWVTSVDG